jgi:hypothetical protein
MADQPYDPYIPNNGAAGSAQGGAPGNQRTAAIQQVGPQPLIFTSIAPWSQNGGGDV